MQAPSLPNVVIDEEALAKLSPERKAGLQQLLGEIQAAFEANPLNAYRPHPKQHEFHSAKTKIKAFIGGHRSGKTLGSVADDLIQALDEDWVPKHLKPYKKWQPPFYGRVITPDFTRTLTYATEALRRYVPASQLHKGNWEDAFDKQNRVLKFANGSRIDYMTHEQDLDKFGGASLHRVHFDEEPPGEKGFAIYKECLARLIDHDGDIVLSMTPMFGLSWVWDEVWVKVEHEERDEGVFAKDGITVVQVDMDDNPHLDEKGKAEFLATLTAEERDARKRGKFVHFAGLVFDEFKERHLVDPPTKEFLRGQAIYLGIDPGLKTTAVVFCAFDSDNHMFVFDELYLAEGSAIPENAAKAIKDKEERWGIKPTFRVIDPAARIRELVHAEQVQAAYARAGLPTVAGQHDVEAGCFEIKRRLQGDILHVSKACRRWRWERERYRIKAREDGAFEVVKANDHLMDATRYVAMARPTSPMPFQSAKKTPTWRYGMAPEWVETPPPTHPLGSMF